MTELRYINTFAMTGEVIWYNISSIWVQLHLSCEFIKLFIFPLDKTCEPECTQPKINSWLLHFNMKEMGIKIHKSHRKVSWTRRQCVLCAYFLLRRGAPPNQIKENRSVCAFSLLHWTWQIRHGKFLSYVYNLSKAGSGFQTVLLPWYQHTSNRR